VKEEIPELISMQLVADIGSDITARLYSYTITGWTSTWIGLVDSCFALFFKQVAVAPSVELAGGTTATNISFKLVFLLSKYVALDHLHI